MRSFLLSIPPLAVAIGLTAIADASKASTGATSSGGASGSTKSSK